MTRTVTVSLPDDVAEEAEAEASERGKTLDEMVTSYVVRHIAWRSIREAQAGNAHLDPDEVMETAYKELRALRAERQARQRAS